MRMQVTVVGLEVEGESVRAMRDRIYSLLDELDVVSEDYGVTVDRLDDEPA